MANTKICDVCRAEGKMVESTFRIGFKGVPKMDTCTPHKEFARGKTSKEFTLEFLKLQEKAFDY